MMRLTVVSIVCAVLGLAGAGAMDGAMAQGKPQCESRESLAPSGEIRDIVCPLSAAGSSQSYRFKANFTGSHDDTSASLAATLDGAPLACAQGSKTNLMGEDGEVSLDCRFAVAPKAGSQQVLRVMVTYRHAQYTDFELVSD